MPSFDFNNKILIWDNDGTISASINPNDKTHGKVVLPGVHQAMEQAKLNFIISGFKSPESELQNFDPLLVAKSFKNLMQQLPIEAAVFSPTIGGIECYVVTKNAAPYNIYHNIPKFISYIGYF